MKRLSQFIVLFILMLSASNAYVWGQIKPQRELDSLLTIAHKTEPDSNSIKAFVSLQRYYFDRGLYDSTLKYAKEALPLAESMGNNKALARIRYAIGMSYTNQNNYDSAKSYLNQALTMALALKDTTLEVTCYNAFSLVYNYQSDYGTSIEYLMKAVHAIDYSHSGELKKMLPQTYNSIAYNFLSEKQYEKAIDYGKKALLIKDYPHEARYRVMLHLTVFDAYLKKHELSLARQYLDSAIATNQNIDNIILSAMVANNEGLYYQTVNDLGKANIAYLKSYQLNKSIDSKLLQSEAGANVASIYFKMKKYTEAERFATEANEIGRQLKLHVTVADTYEVLKNIAEQQGDFKQALIYAEQSKIFADSALNEETRKITLSLESKYQNQKKEREIAALTIANTENELEVLKRNRFLIAGGVGASGALIILGLLYRNSRQKNLLAEQERKYHEEQIKFLERQQQVVSLQSMINGQEAERTRIAKDLHDGLGGLFSTVKMYFSTLQHDTPVLKENDLFQKSYSIVDTASVEVRRIAHNMMPEVLMKLGLANAIKDLCDNISAGKLLTVSLEVHGMNKRLNATTEIMLFRIIQELLNNIIKHAHATEAIIQFIRENERLSVIVEDNGQGFNTQEADEQNHSGIATIQSRVNYLNGKMSIDSEKNVGTTIMMDFLINE